MRHTHTGVLDADLPLIGARRAYAEVIGLYAVAFAPSIAFILSELGGPVDGPTANLAHAGSAALVGYLTQTAAIAWLAIILARRRGLTMESFGIAGLRARRMAIGVFWASFISLWVAAVVAGWLEVGLNVSMPATGQVGIVTSAVAATYAAVVEEVVVVGTLVSALQAARRPMAEIMVLGVVARLAYHAYYGLVALSVIVWAVLFLILYARTRQLLPLIFAHAGYDFMVMSRSAVVGVLVLGIAIIMTVAFLRRGTDDRSLGTSD